MKLVQFRDIPYTMKQPYPLAVVFIVGSRLFERFFYNGLQTIFPLYLVGILDFSQTDATLMFHIYCMLGSLFPIVAGFLADSSLGKYRTIFYLTVVYVAGSAILDVGSTPLSETNQRREITIIAILAISLGGGCASITLPFGGDQFSPASHSKQLTHFFSLTYITDNVSILAAIFLTPILRHNYQCFGHDTCFPLAFGFLCLMLAASLGLLTSALGIIDQTKVLRVTYHGPTNAGNCLTDKNRLRIGKNTYVHQDPERNVIVDVTKCTFYAFYKKFRSDEKKEHWLDFAEDKFSKTLITDAKAAFKVLFLFLPVPVFWALDDQLGSTWKFQAMHMDGSLGWFTIKPDQMQVLDPVLTILLVPLFTFFVYPWLAKYHFLEHPIQRFCLGGLLAAASFVIAAIIELKIQSTLPQLPQAGTAQLRVFNGLNCDVRFNNPLAPKNGVIPSLDALQMHDVPQVGYAEYNLSFTTADDCRVFTNHTFGGKITLQEHKASSIFLHSKEKSPIATQIPGFDLVDKTSMENPKLRILYDLAPFQDTVVLFQDQFTKTFSLSENMSSTPLKSVAQIGRFSAKLGSSTISADIELGPAGIYTLILHSYNNTTVGRLISVTPPNSVHMLWQLPQYVTITVAEVVFAITGIEFSYTQAPESMKSLISAVWSLTDAFGNIIVIAVVEGHLFQNQVWEFLFFAGMMLVACLILKAISRQYQYNVPVTVRTITRQ